MNDTTTRLAASLADRYRIERELGQGGMATVYLAHDLKHDRDVAIKVLHPELGAALGGERFLSEIRTTARLQHPHILPLLDSGTAGALLYYVMPVVTGETLRVRIARERQLPIADAVRIAREVASALDYAHRQGVVHRDIKPENVLLHDGQALVADFGIALAVQQAGGQRMTQTGLSLGTPQYMSPEQAMGEKTIDARSDVYSLGAVTYEMLTGEPPFTGPTVQAIVAKVLTSAPEPVTTIRKSVPPHVATAIHTALEKLPADRFATTAEFAASLGDGSTIRQPAHTLASRASAPRRWLALAAITLASALGVALGWSLARAPGAPGPTEYDVGLPDSAAMHGLADAGLAQAPLGFAVSPAGDFVVYQTMRDGRTELWYRSLRDATTRRIDGTTDGRQPAISPDGTQIALFRLRGQEWSVEVMPVSGGAATTLVRGTSHGTLQWLDDGRILIVDGDGSRARWLDPAGGATTTRRIAYCPKPAPLPDTNTLLCSGGGNNFAYRIDLPDLISRHNIRSATKDSGIVFGSDFRVTNGRYVTFISQGGDLLAASIDPAARRVGQPVRMATGLGVRAYFRTGSYAISASGTLVYAEGGVRSVGHLVRATDRSLDTLPVGREAFYRFAFSPDGKQLAAVVEGHEGEELRIYDVASGKHVVWVRRPSITQPTWSPRGDRVAFWTQDSVFVGSPNAASTPEFVVRRPEWEGFTWLPDDRLIGNHWDHARAGAIHLDRRPATVDSLFSDAVFVRASPDGRWITYSSGDLSKLWLEPFPRTGTRYEVASGNREDAQWLSPTEFVYSVYDPPLGFDRVTLDPRRDPPIVARRRWIDAPRFVATAGSSFALTPDARVAYVQADEDVPVRYLRVIPNWVARMQQAVDAANR